MSKYNGWTNRETWLVNIRFMDSQDYDETISAEYIEELVSEYVYEQIEVSGFIADMIDMGCINWQELANSHNSQIEAA